ncbi:putative mitochondrial protein, partial [Mucuna pruriens]
MVQECIVLGHKLSLNWIEVDLAKVEKIFQRLRQNCQNYTDFLTMGVEFEFSDACLKAFELLQDKLSSVYGDNVVRRCVSFDELHFILVHYHSMEFLQNGFYWPTLFSDPNYFIRSCDSCQRIGNISRHQEMPQNNLLVCEFFTCEELTSWVCFANHLLMSIFWWPWIMYQNGQW